MLNDFKGNPDPEVGGDEICLEFVPLDFRPVGDLVVEVLEKAGHFGGRCSEVGKRGARRGSLFFGIRQGI